MALKDRLKPKVEPEKRLEIPDIKDEDIKPNRRKRVGNGNGFSVPGYPGKGEPSHYTPDIIAKMYAYFNKDPWEMHYTDKGTAQMIARDKLPTFQRFASMIGFTPRALAYWCDKYPEFKAAYEDCKEMQKAFILESGGLTLNGNFAMFMLKCNHGMLEPKQDIGDEEIEPVRVVIEVEDGRKNGES